MQEKLEKNNIYSNKNHNCISWDDYFATIAEITSLRSKDPVRKVGAIIVSEDNKILSTGYNGAPIGINDTEISWNKEGEFLDTKYPYIVHAELNAILNYNNDKALLKGAKIYTTLFPCNECMKAIIQSGITEVIYLDNHNYKKNIYVASRYMIKKHNQNLKYPKIILRSYQKSNLATLLTTKTVLQDKIIVTDEEVESYDKAFFTRETSKGNDQINPSIQKSRESKSLKLTFGKKENK